MLLKRISTLISELFYPKKCLYCGWIVPNYGKLCICPRCSEIKTEPFFCKNDEHVLDRTALLLKYSGNVRRTMVKFKFEGNRYYGYTFGKVVYDSVGAVFFPKGAVVTCIPLTKSRKRKYNQSEVIASEVCKLSASEFQAHMLRKTRDIAPLSKLKRSERKLMVRDTVSVNPYHDVYRKHVIVIDDIFTTGSTVNTAARSLIAYGAKKVDAVCTCTKKRY